MRTAQIEAQIAKAEKQLYGIAKMFQRIDQRRDLAAFTKVYRAMGEQRTFRDIDGRERVIGWNERKRDRPRCGARTRAGGACKAPVVRGKSRCRMHGGLSTGPKTPEGKARTLAALKAGFQRWVAQRRAQRAALNF
jgi:hypothetical protein